MSSQTGTVSSTTGSSGWTNPNNIFTSNNTYSVSVSVASSGTTGFVYALANGFSIPSSATIDGLEVSIEAKNQLSGTGFRVRPANSDVFIRSAGADISSSSPAGVSNATWTGTTDSSQTLGSSTALWSTTLTPSIINDSSFGIRVRFFNVNASSQTFSIDRIAITVYYTAAGVQSSQQLFMYEG